MNPMYVVFGLMGLLVLAAIWQALDRFTVIDPNTVYPRRDRFPPRH